MRRLLQLGAIALVAAGCASATAGGPGQPDGAASLLPGSTVTFVAAETDRLTDAFMTEPAWLTNIRPALGDEVDVATLPGDEVVAFTQPDDEAKLADLAAKNTLELREVGDWTAIAKTRAALAKVGPTALSLAEYNRFRAAMERVPSDSFVRVYANADQAKRLAAAFPGQLTTTNAPLGTRFRFSKPCTDRPTAATLGCLDYRWAAAGLRDEKGGYRIEGVLKTGELLAPDPPRYVTAPTAPYTPGLVEEIPADALALVDFPVPSSTFQLLSELPPPLAGVFGADRFELGTQLDALLHGETALYVRASLPQPEFTVVTQPTDTAAAVDALNELVAHAPKDSILRRTQLHHAVIGGQLVISTTRQGVADFRGAGPKLSADETFLKAKELSGMGDETTGFVYANTEVALPLLRLAGVKLPADLPDIRTVFGYGAQGINERTFTTFVQVGSR